MMTSRYPSSMRKVKGLSKHVLYKCVRVAEGGRRLFKMELEPLAGGLEKLNTPAVPVFGDIDRRIEEIYFRRLSISKCDATADIILDASRPVIDQKTSFERLVAAPVIV